MLSVDELSGPEARRVSVLAEISTEMVRLFKEQFGRGPTSARAAWAGDDTLVVETFVLHPAGSELPSRADIADRRPGSL